MRERQRWDDYQTAFSEVLSHTSTEKAPWYVLPADHKWFARIGAAAVIANALIEIDPRFPVVDEQARRDLLAVKVQLENEAPEGAASDPFQQEVAEAAARAEAVPRAKASHGSGHHGG